MDKGQLRIAAEEWAEAKRRITDWKAAHRELLVEFDVLAYEADYRRAIYVECVKRYVVERDEATDEVAG